MSKDKIKLTRNMLNANILITKRKEDFYEKYNKNFFNISNAF